MARKQIVLTVDPKGVFSEGTAVADITPGVGVAVAAAVEPVNGRYSYAASATPIAFTREDVLLGRTVNDTYLATERIFIYTPNAGEELQLLAAAGEVAYAIGDEVGPTATGEIGALGSGYIVMETLAAAAGLLVHVQKNLA